MILEKIYLMLEKVLRLILCLLNVPIAIRMEIIRAADEHVNSYKFSCTAKGNAICAFCI
jgi:hypothetical protein